MMSRTAKRAMIGIAVGLLHPKMSRVIVLLHAEDETASRLRSIARQARA